ncbi:uncharacterized protein MONOS_7508 [Monocercomonoides exilis]|uniref:uncharacterized protein n=1 Tax=Monocercomonoides exilis TaxID=2049356 RepID=UPI00355A89A2|nr:hypothetical protein MONOS_7508 [Monocercomonoides exilis]|eukprot:MONOS_7508.1-p1 / transcript=MONOS_7508.1 / gene=MONOS_7508 / organism=Monocercomonoides_exilis_PA203 / gene_product=unspecified product / transcript_product=unspecified product / location=Mono_scaffold00258:19327-19920(+) / protein_length=198 / sequence_SO=supercontig / SO=protein_coding / is_pseudo=false
MRSISPSPASAPHCSTSIPPSYPPPQRPASISPSSQASLPSNYEILARNNQLSSLTPSAFPSPSSSSSFAPQTFDRALSGATSSISTSSSSSSYPLLPQQQLQLQQQSLHPTAVFQSLPSVSQLSRSAERAAESVRGQRTSMHAEVCVMFRIAWRVQSLSVVAYDSADRVYRKEWMKNNRNMLGAGSRSSSSSSSSH